LEGVAGLGFFPGGAWPRRNKARGIPFGKKWFGWRGMRGGREGTLACGEPFFQILRRLPPGIPGKRLLGARWGKQLDEAFFAAKRATTAQSRRPESIFDRATSLRFGQKPAQHWKEGGPSAGLIGTRPTLIIDIFARDPLPRGKAREGAQLQVELGPGQ